MQRILQSLVVVAIGALSLPNAAAADRLLTRCSEETAPDGAITLLCKPRIWNGELLVYAHGYVSPAEPLALPDEAPLLAEAVALDRVAFATTSLSENGFAVDAARSEIPLLVDAFAEQYGTPERVYLAGPSQGGHITALLLESRPDLFAGGMALCGPYGDYTAQIDHIGDFRVLFDYYFPGLLPGSPVAVPPRLLEDWEDIYAPLVEAAVRAEPAKARELLAVADVAWQPDRPQTGVSAVLEVLRYGVIATNDMIDRLGGQPFDNAERVYRGSADDTALNSAVARFTADPQARAAATRYDTSGALSVPTVLGHTTGDPVIPIRQYTDYLAKIAAAGSAAAVMAGSPERFGHCNFTIGEVLSGITALLERVRPDSGAAAPRMPQGLSDEERRRRLELP